MQRIRINKNSGGSLSSGGLSLFSVAIVAFLLILLTPSSLLAQEDEMPFDEIMVFVSVPRVGGADVSALIKEETIYLSVTELFSSLKIKNSYTPGFDTVSGFFINEQASYLIDRVKNTVTYRGKSFTIKDGDMVRTETGLYLKSDYFGEIFELPCTFNVRSLTVVINTKLELPYIREMRIEQMRQNLRQLKGEIKADTSYKSDHPFFSLGMADWSLTSSQQKGIKPNTRGSLNLGTVIVGGEANFNMNFDDSRKFSFKDQYYQWRYVNNNIKTVRQILAGKFATESYTSLNAPLIGGRITNTPTTYRGTYGSYKLSDFTEPGWTVELYVNNVLIDYKKADASGFFSFDVPLIYGNTNVKLQFYGPWGEERSKEQNITIPFNFMPKGVFEYNIAGGYVDDTLKTRFGRVDFDYGVNRSLTFGGGVEYSSKLVGDKRVMPFVNTSLRLASSLIFSGEYVYGVKAGGIMNLQLPSELQMELTYVKYDKNQTALNTSYTEERKAALLFPLRTKKLTLFTKMALNQYLLPQSKYTSAELMFSGSMYGVNANIATNALFTKNTDPVINTLFSLSVRLPGNTILSPQAQYDFSNSELVSAKAMLEKRILRSGYITMSYERNFRSNYTNIEGGIRFDLNFAQVNMSARRSGGRTQFTQSASGSLIADTKTGYIGANRRLSVGKGGISLYPFLDLNGNGEHDKGEPKIAGLNVNVNGGRVEYNEKDTILRVFDLEPYTDYLLNLDAGGFENISWRLKSKSLSVSVDPNRFKLIKLPISILGEAAGTLYMGIGSSLKGQGRILVNFYNKQTGKKISSTMTESDGFFSYMGLSSGDYIVAVDSSQMRKLDMTATPAQLEISVKNTTEGDYIEGLEFVIRSNSEGSEATADKAATSNTITTSNTISTSKNIPSPALTTATKPAAGKDKVTTGSSGKDSSVNGMVYRVQLIALRKPLNTRQIFGESLRSIPDLEIFEIFSDDGFIRYCTQPFAKLKDALALQRKLKENGWKDSFVAIYSSNERGYNNINNTIKEVSKKLFAIQLLAVPKPVEIDTYFAKILSRFPEMKISEIKGDDGLYRYKTIPYTAFGRARDVVNVIKTLGWRDSFIFEISPE